MNQIYLGDSVYAEHKGFHVVVYTDNGHGPENEIFLEDTVAVALIKFLEKSFKLERVQEEV